jgi:large subunit ribosomal protein L1
VHVIIGKTSFDTLKLKENFEVFIDALRKAKPIKSKGVYIKNVAIASTMGPGIKIQL